MKKILPLIITAALLCSGCQKQNLTESSPTDSTQASTSASEVLSPADSAPADSSNDVTDNADLPRFMTGTYLLSSNEVHIGYMFVFDAEDYLASFYTFDMGFEQEVSYKIINNTVELNGENDSVILDVVSGDLSFLNFKTADGLDFRLEYFSESMPDEILGNFYSNPQLCEIALDYYEAQNGRRPSYCVVTMNEDGMVSLNLYDDTDDSAPIAIYTVDRTNCSGTDDLLGTSINLEA